MFVHTPVELQELTTKQLKGYRWYCISKDIWYPSITSVLSSKSKDFLVNWKALLGEDKAAKELKRCSDRGTAVHDMCEKYLLNNPTPGAGHAIEHVKLFNQLKLKLKKIDNIVALEAPLYSHELMVAGRVDCIAEYEGILSIIDFKSSTNLKTEEMIFDYYLQETFYALAFTELTGIPVTQIVTIMTVERSIMPVVWVRDIAPYITELQDRINLFYDKL